jgi:hypothetical protein
MKKKSDESGFLASHLLIGLLVLLASALLVAFGSGVFASNHSRRNEVCSDSEHQR